MKGWVQCLMSESKGRFLVNNILMFGSVIAQIQFYLIKKRIGRPEHSLTPHPSTPNDISFLPYPPTPLKVDVICVSPLNVSIND